MSTTTQHNEPGAVATVPQPIAEELRQAAVRVRAIPGCDFAEPLANWLEHTADNMQDEQAFEKTFDRPDGSTFTEVVTESRSHLGLPSEWTAALDTARRINQASVVTNVERISDERVQEILDGLNAFVVREYEGGTHLVNGVAKPCAEVVGCDANLDKAVDWALDLPEVSIACGPDTDGSAEIELVDKTIIEWDATSKQWAVTVSDECDTSEVTR